MKDRDEPVNNGDDVSAGLMAFNLASEQSAAGFRIGGNVITSIPLAYNSYTGV